MAYQLGDLAAVRTSSTVLTIGAGCAPFAPCNVRFGYQVYSITNSATATSRRERHRNMAYIYVNSSGTLMVGNNLTVACSAGCTQQAGYRIISAERFADLYLDGNQWHMG
jgi:predicted ATP-grasp superfamily ATP-dependent carboligase